MSERQHHCSHREAQRRHSRKRMAERYGEADEAVIRAITRAVKRARKKIERTRKWDNQRIDVAGPPAAWREAKSPDRELWRVDHEGQTYRVAWSVPRAQIITFLPNDVTRHAAAARNAKRASALDDTAASQHHDQP